MYIDPSATSYIIQIVAGVIHHLRRSCGRVLGEDQSVVPEEKN